MADEFVRVGQFEENSRRMDERFIALEKKMDQGFTHAAKERENILVHLNQRFDAVNQRFDDMKESVNQRFDAVYQRFDGMNQGMNQRFDDMNQGMNQRFDDVHRRLDDLIASVKQGFDTMEKRFDYQNRFVVGVVTTILAATLAVVGKYLFFS